MGSAATSHGGLRSGIWTRRAAGGRRSTPRSASSTSRASRPLSERLARRGRIGAEELTERPQPGLRDDARRWPTSAAAACSSSGAMRSCCCSPARTTPRRPPAPRSRCGPRCERPRRSRRRSVGCRCACRSASTAGRSTCSGSGRATTSSLIAGPAATATTADGARRRAGPDRRQRRAPARRCRPRAADEPGGPGLLLRWRQPKAAPLAPGARPPRPCRSGRPTASRRPCAATSSSGRVEPEHRAATVAFLRFSGIDALWPPRDPTPSPRRSTRSSPRCRTRPTPRRSPSSPPTSTRTAGRSSWPPGVPSTAGRRRGPDAPLPPPDRRRAACRCRSRSASTAATSSSATSAWPTARRSRSWATP